MALPDRVTGDGFDVQMQTNHLSHFLLTKELCVRSSRKEHGPSNSSWQRALPRWVR